MTTTQTQTQSGTKLVAKCTTTGLYFNGTNFSAVTAAGAMALRPGTVANDFKLSWSAPVEIETTDADSLAMRIHKGEITRDRAAKEYIIRTQRETGQKSFTIRTPQGDYIGRRVTVPARHHDAAFVKWNGSEIAVVWSRGELAIDSLSA